MSRRHGRSCRCDDCDPCGTRDYDDRKAGVEAALRPDDEAPPLTRWAQAYRDAHAAKLRRPWWGET